MRLYFDTSVYDDIAKAGATHEVASRLRRARVRLTASSDNLFELLAIRETTMRADQLRTLTSVATHFGDKPTSLREAQEVARALHRHRPEWTRRFTFTRARRARLQAHNRRWQDAKRGIVPYPAAYAEYRRSYEQSVAGARGAQRQMRQAHREKKIAVIVKQFGDTLGAVRTSLDEPDPFWRLENWMAYDGALVHHHPATKDLADWLVPALKLHLVTSEELFLFWGRDVQAEEVPLSQWSGLVVFGQLRQKISHSNAADQLHAAHALTVDTFATADRGFAAALEVAREHYPHPVAHIMYWNRDAGTPLEKLEALLRG